jgi:hypothetical protein
MTAAGAHNAPLGSDNKVGIGRGWWATTDCLTSQASSRPAAGLGPKRQLITVLLGQVIPRERRCRLLWPRFLSSDGRAGAS